jgi:peptidoglycan-associated lipoprotein
MTKRRVALTAAAALTLVLAVGCGKKRPPPPPPPPPPPSAGPVANKPTINYFNAEPTTVNSGQPSSLRWSVSDAANVQIDGIGQVSPSGRRAVYPTETTKYHMVATSPGGTTEADVTVTVSAPAPPPVVSRPQTVSPAQALADQVKDVHFEYDKADVIAEDAGVLAADANALKTIFATDPTFVVLLEGHCDERGSAEYNIGLGDRRAAATKKALVDQGVPADKLKTISYGKERPICTDESEDCYQRNRRAHFSAGQ